MSVFMFVTIDAGGNVPPAANMGRELLARGHRVRFLGHERQRAALTSAGFEFSPFQRMPPWEPARPRPVHGSIADFLRMSTDPGPGQDLTDLLSGDPADLVIIDCMLLSVLQAAQRQGQKHVVLFHSFYRYWDRNFATGPVGILARLRGLDARTLWAGASLELVASDPGLDPAGHHRNATRTWCGVVEHAAPPIAKPPGDPMVLVSLSTLWVPGQEDAYRRILLALASLPIKAVVTTGPSVDPAELAAPPNVEVLTYASHARLMPGATAVIGHGGHSTTMAALLHGLPLLLIPMHPFIDQPMVSKAVADAGAGIRLKKKASPEAIRRALMDLLDTSGFTAAARSLGTRLRAAPGAPAAADQLLAVLHHPDSSACE